MVKVGRMDAIFTKIEQDAINLIVGGMKPLFAMRKAGLDYNSSSKRGRKLRNHASECKARQETQR